MSAIWNYRWFVVYNCSIASGQIPFQLSRNRCNSAQDTGEFILPKSITILRLKGALAQVLLQHTCNQQDYPQPPAQMLQWITAAKLPLHFLLIVQKTAVLAGKHTLLVTTKGATA